VAESENNETTRQERREQKLKKKKERVVVHGKSIAQIYRNVIDKKLKKDK
jgi:hypothetical protein